MKFPIILILVFLSILTTVSAFSNADIQDLVDLASFNTVNVDSISCDNWCNITLSRDDTKVELYNVTNIMNLEYLYFNPNLDFDTSAVSIKGINIYKATIYLAKNKNGTVNKILHSDNGFNFSTYYTDISQNNSMVWFNVTHFSSWTSAIDDIYMFHDIVDSGGTDKEGILIDISDYASIDSGDCFSFTYLDKYNNTTFSKSSCSGFNDFITYSDDISCYGEPVLSGYVEDLNLFLIPSEYCDEYYIDTYSGNRFSIWDSSGNTEKATSNQVDIIIKNFNPPDVTALNPSSITTTGFTAKCNTQFNDLNNLGFYTYTPTFDNRFYVYYRKVGAQSYTTTSAYYNVYDSTTKEIPIAGLDSDTNYEYRCYFQYYDISKENNNVNGEKISDLVSVKTLAVDTPTPYVGTVNAITGDSQFQPRAIVGYDGYTGGDLGLYFVYSDDNFATSTRYPSSGYLVPTDEVLYTGVAETGLTNDQEYKYYASIVWDSGTETATGDTLTFTPSAPSSGGNYFSNIIAYYKLEETDFNYADEVNNLDLTNGVKPTQATGIINYGQDFDSSNSEYIEYSNSIFNVNYWALSFWINPASSPSSYNRILGTYNTKGFAINRNSDGTIGIGQYNSDGHDYITTSSIPNNQFTHIFVWYDGDLHACINGVSDYSETSEGTSGVAEYPSVTPYFTIGTEPIHSAGQFFDGVIDEVYYSSDGNSISDCSEASILYNSGSGLSYSEILNYGNNKIDYNSIQTLDASLIDYDFAGMSGIATFNASINTATGSFNYRPYGSTTWINATPPYGSITNETTYTEGYHNLKPNTLYEYQAFMFINGSSSLGYFGNLVNFTTLESPKPDISTNKAFNITNESSVIGCDITDLYAYDDINIYFKYRKYSEGSYTQTSYTNYNTTQTINKFIDSLEPETLYYYYCLGDYTAYHNETVSGEVKSFSTIETGGVQTSLNNIYDIRRTTARFNGSLNSLGYYTNASIYFAYNSSNESYTTDKIYYTEDNIDFTVDVENLTQNTSYDVYLIAEYGVGRNTTTEKINFKTLSTTDFIAPSIDILPILDSNILYNSVVCMVDVKLEDIDSGSVYYNVYKPSTSLGNSSDYIFVNTTGIKQYTATGLDSATKYYCQAGLIYYINETSFLLETEKEYFTTLDKTASPKTITLFGTDIYIDNPYLFDIYVISGITFMLLSLIFVNKLVGVSQDDRADKFLVYLTLTIVSVSLLFIYLSLLLQTWVFILTIILSILLVLNIKGGRNY